MMCGGRLYGHCGFGVEVLACAGVLEMSRRRDAGRERRLMVLRITMFSKSISYFLDLAVR